MCHTFVFCHAGDVGPQGNLGAPGKHRIGRPQQTVALWECWWSFIDVRVVHRNSWTSRLPWRGRRSGTQRYPTRGRPSVFTLSGLTQSSIEIQRQNKAIPVNFWHCRWVHTVLKRLLALMLAMDIFTTPYRWMPGGAALRNVWRLLKYRVP